MRLLGYLVALIVALPLAAACSGSGTSGAGGASSTTGQGGHATPIHKTPDGGSGAGGDLESSGPGW